MAFARGQEAFSRATLPGNEGSHGLRLGNVAIAEAGVALRKGSSGLGTAKTGQQQATAGLREAGVGRREGHLWPR